MSSHRSSRGRQTGIVLDLGSIRSSILGSAPHAASAIAKPFSRSVLPVGLSEDAVPYWLYAEHKTLPGYLGKPVGVANNEQFAYSAKIEAESSLTALHCVGHQGESSARAPLSTAQQAGWLGSRPPAAHGIIPAPPSARKHPPKLGPRIVLTNVTERHFMVCKTHGSL